MAGFSRSLGHPMESRKGDLPKLSEIRLHGQNRLHMMELQKAGIPEDRNVSCPHTGPHAHHLLGALMGSKGNK